MKNNHDETIECPCKSGKLYKECCKPFHMGKSADSPLTLMRSRYAAYALNLAEYIIQTTHRENSEFTFNTKDWAKKISEFSLHTEFRDLEILDFEDKSPFATVTFFAHLFQNGKDVSFKEKSLFEKVKDKWLYKHGVLK